MCQLFVLESSVQKNPKPTLFPKEFGVVTLI